MKKLVSIIVILLLFFGLSLTPVFNIKQVNSAEGQVPEELSEWLKEQNWFWRKEAWLENNIPKRYYYESVDVIKQMPFGVELKLVPREPFIAIQSGGYYVIIDIYGVVLALSDDADAPYLIKGFGVTSAVVGNTLVAEDMRLIERAVQIVYMLKTHTSYTPDVYLSEGYIYQKMSEDVLINFGLAEDVEKQFNHAIIAYKNMLEKKSTSGIVNVSNPNQCIIEPIKR